MAEWKLEVAIFSEHFTGGYTCHGRRVVVIVHASVKRSCSLRGICRYCVIQIYQCSIVWYTSIIPLSVMRRRRVIFFVGFWILKNSDTWSTYPPQPSEEIPTISVTPFTGASRASQPSKLTFNTYWECFLECVSPFYHHYNAAQSRASGGFCISVNYYCWIRRNLCFECPAWISIEIGSAAHTNDACRQRPLIRAMEP